VSKQQVEEEEHHEEKLNQQKGGKLESEGGGIKSGNIIPLGQFVVEEGPNNNGLQDDIMVNDNLDDNEVVDNGLEDEVAVNNILEMEEEMVEDDNEVIQIFHSPEAANSHNVERIHFEEYMTFQKVICPQFKDVGYMSLYGEFFKCYICTKHCNPETFKDAHDNFCKQSRAYRES